MQTTTEAKALDYDQLCQDYMTAIYKGVSGFISYQPGEKESYAEKKIYLTYGEILYPSLNKIIDFIDINEKDVVYDLGSGVGKVALQFLLKTPVKKAFGIEASQKRHAMAEKVYEKVKQEFPELFKGGRKLETYQGDFLQRNLEDVTIIYSCSTCFKEELLSDMGKMMDTYPNLRYIITMKPIPNRIPNDTVLDIECTWDKTKCHVYSWEQKEVST